ncbi:MAG: alpha/beta fold hydrolase [Gemmatimonadales bacterium]
MPRWLRLLGPAVMITAGAGYLAALTTFQLSKRARLRALATGSTVTTTAQGPIEFARAGDGPPVLVLPGSFGGYDQALKVGRDLADRGFAIIAVSRPGYLRTPLATGTTPAEQAEAMVVLLDSLRLPRVAVLGISGGGPSALELAARHPDRVHGLVLVAALSGPKAQPPTPPPAATWGDKILGAEFSAWWQLRQLERSGTKALDSPIFSPDTKKRLAESPALLDRFFELAWFRFPTAQRWAGYLNDRATFGQFDFAGFESITTPTLIVHGTLDRNAPIEHGDRAATRIAGARYLKIEGGDHYSSIARGDTVWTEVASFLRSIAATR